MELVGMTIDESKQHPTDKRVLPRVSSATGGPAPRIDLSDFSSLQEMEDIEYIERMMKGFK